MSDISLKVTRRSAFKRALTFSGAGMALAGAGLGFSPPARAATKVRGLTNFFAEPGHGGIYQAKVTGLYEKAGLDGEITQGGAQIHGMPRLSAWAAHTL